jgi:hypothetical protein
MKKTIIMMGVCVLLVSVVIQIGGNQAVWAEEGSFLFSSISNNTWVLDKSSRQLILVNFEKPDQVWKSDPVTIPVNFDLSACQLEAVGIRGTAVFLIDTSAGLVTFYDAKDDGSVKVFKVVNIKELLK